MRQDLYGFGVSARIYRDLELNEVGNSFLYAEEFTCASADLELHPAPALCASPSSLSFGNQENGTTSAPQTVTLQNCGTTGSSLTISSVAVTGLDKDDFKITADSGQTTLAVGATRTVSIVFQPTDAGSRSANLTITSNDPNAPTRNVPLSGNGVCPPVKIICSNITQANDAGQCGARVSFQPIISGGCPPVNLFCFIGTSTQVQSGDVFPVGTTLVTCEAFDSHENVTRCTFTITVTDAEKPTITCPNNITANTDPGHDFATVASPQATATDNCPGVQVVGVRSDEKALTAPYPLGITTIAWTATDQAGNQVSCSQTVTVIVPKGTVSPTSLDFGNQQLRTSSTPKSITVFSTGTAPLVVSGINISGDPDFAVTAGGGSFTLAPGASRTISVVFTPITVGERRATLTITSNALGGLSAVQLTGNGTNPPPPTTPDLDIQPRSVSFGPQALGTISAPQTLKIINLGPVPLVVQDITFVGANPNDFFFTVGGVAGITSANRLGFGITATGLPVTVPVKGFVPIDISFAPTALGPRSATLLITSNATGSPHIVPLAGFGIQAVEPQPVGPLIKVTDPVALRTPGPGVEFFGASPPPPGSTDFTSVRGATPDGSLFLVDWAGTAFLRVPPALGSPAEIVLDSLRPTPSDGVGLARLLRAEINSSGIAAVLALRADNTRGIYRLDNGSLTTLGVLPDPRGSRELAIGDEGQIAFVASVDPNDPASPLALFLAAGGQRVELLRAGQDTVNGVPIGTIVGFSDLTGNNVGDLAVLVTNFDGTPLAVLRKRRTAPLEVLAVIDQVVAQGSGSSVTGALTDFRHPRIGPDGSVVFLGDGANFINFYISRSEGPPAPLLAAPETDRSMLDESPLIQRRFDYETASDGTVGLQFARADATDSRLLLVAPGGGVTQVVAGQRTIEPILRPVFGPGGVLLFLAQDQTQPVDRSGEFQVGLYRYRQDGSAPEPVARPGDPVPGWSPDTRLLSISQRPVVVGNDLVFGILFGGPESLPVPTPALFRVPLGATLANGALVAPEGHNETDASRLAMLRELSYQSNGTLVAYGLMPGAGPLIAPTTATETSAGDSVLRELTAALSTTINPLVGEGDTLGLSQEAGELENVLPPLLSQGLDRSLFAARTSRLKSSPRQTDTEGLFTVDTRSHVDRVGVSRVNVGGLAGATFNGFVDIKAFQQPLSPPSVGSDGRVVFKALLNVNNQPMAAMFQWSPGSDPVLIRGPEDPEALLGWAAGKSGINYVLEKNSGSTAQLLAGSGSSLQPVATLGVTPDMLEVRPDGGVLLVPNAAGDLFVVGAGPNGPGVYRLAGNQLVPLTDTRISSEQSVKDGLVPPSDQGNNFKFVSNFEFAPDSARGNLIFRATVQQPGGPLKRGELELDSGVLFTRQIASVDLTSARTLRINPLGTTMPVQSKNGISVSARFDVATNGWSLRRFQRLSNGKVSQVTIAQDKKGNRNSRFATLDAGALLEQETDLRVPSGPVFTINDSGAVAFLASDGQLWGVYQVPAP